MNEYQGCKKQTYLDEFLSLRCAGDVLNIASPIQRAAKEISESMAMIKHLRKIAGGAPGKYVLFDLAAGNALTSLLAIHLLPFNSAVAIDKRSRVRPWERALHFEYHTIDLFNLSLQDILSETVILSVHPCRDVAERVVQIYNESPAEHLVLMPCCIGPTRMSVPDQIRQQVGRYMVWCWHLAEKCKGTVKFRVDERVLSPANCIIVARKV